MLEFINLSVLFSLSPRAEEPPLTDTAIPSSSRAFLEQIQQRNSEALKEIIETTGWPSESSVGDYAEAAAFMVVLHADYDPDFQRQCHGLLLQSAESGDTRRLGFLAYLTDRILCNDHRHQRFGTQIREVSNGCFVPKPLEDPDHVEELRQQAGLSESLAEYYQRVNDGDLLLARPLLAGYGEQMEHIHRAEVLPFPGKRD